MTQSQTLKQQLLAVREELIAIALRQTDGNVTKAARLLGVWRSRLHVIIKKSARLKKLTKQERKGRR